MIEFCASIEIGLVYAATYIIYSISKWHPVCMLWSTIFKSELRNYVGDADCQSSIVDTKHPQYQNDAVYVP